MRASAFARALEEAEMYIGEIEEVGIIEPLAIPESRPAESDPDPDHDGAAPRKIEEPVPAR